MSNVLNLTKYECDCGSTHEIKTQIVSGKGVLTNISLYIQKVFSAGNIAVCTAKDVKDTAEIVQKGLYRAGYTVRSFCIDEDKIVNLETIKQFLNLPECVRFLIGVGSGSIADMVRYAAKKLGIGYALVATAPSTDSYLSSSVFLLDKSDVVKCNNPDMLIIDDGLIAKAPAHLVASGYGRVVAQIVKIFDIQYNKYALANLPCETIVNELAREVHQFELDKSKADFEKRLMKLLIKISCANEYLDMSYSGVDCFARMLTHKIAGRTEGENSMLASYIVLNLYRCYLNNDAIDTMLPPDIIKSIKLLEKSNTINYNKYISSFNMTTVNDYLKQTFILSEYRVNLFELITDIDISEIARFWRRLYSDAGYWLKDYVTNSQLMRYLSLSAEISKGSLIKHIKRLGFLENYI